MEPFLGGQVSLLHAFIIFVVINEQLLNLNNRWARFLWCVFIASDFLSDYVDGSVVLEQQLQGGSKKTEGEKLLDEFSTWPPFYWSYRNLKD